MDYYKTTVLFQPVVSESVKKALFGKSGSTITKDYRNIEVLSSFIELDIPGISWALLAEIDSQEIFYSVKKEAWKSLFILSIVFVFSILASSFLGRLLYKPIRSLAKSASELGKGNFDIQADISKKGELGDIAKNFNDTVHKLKKRREEILQKNKLLKKQADELQVQSKNLKKLNDNILYLNKSLDKKVKERTLKLQEQNKKLLQYAHFNSHQLRTPVSNILGLMEAIKICNDENDKKLFMEFIEQATQDLDVKVLRAQEMLNQVEITE